MSTEPVFDFVPPGFPPLMNSAIRDAVETAERSPAGSTAWEAFLDEQVRQLQTDRGYGERLREQLRAAGTNLICPTVWSTDPTVSAREGTYHDLTRWTARFDALDWLEKVTTPAEANDVVDRGDVGIVLGTQDLGAFTAGHTTRVDELYNAGLRIMQLTYNTQNHIGAGCTEPSNSGLSGHGLAVVRALNRLGVVIDLSHCNGPTTLDAIQSSRSPTAITHSHCGALHDHHRSKSDEELRALADNDGYMGILVYPHQYETPTFDTFFDHLEHALSIVGPDHVGVATDWCITTPDVPAVLRRSLVSFFRRQTAAPPGRSDGGFLTAKQFDTEFDGIAEYSDRHRIRAEFEQRGYGSETIRKLLGGNFLAFWDRVISAR